MEERVGEYGYDSTTVPQVIKAARVSTATFYRFFSDKVDCFIAVCEERGDALLQELFPDEHELRSYTASQRLDRGLRTYLRFWADNPALARAYFVELPAAGPRAVSERDRQYERFAALNRMLALNSREQLGGAAPPDIDVRASVIVITELIAAEIRAGNAEQLPQLHDDLRRLLLKLLGPTAIALEP